MNAPWSIRTKTGTAASNGNVGRRRFLSVTGSVVALLLAGCSGDGDGGDGSPTPTPDPGGSSTETESPTPAETSTPESTPTEADPDGSDPAAFERQAREFVELLVDGSFEAAHDRFTESAAAELSATQLEQAWDQVTRNTGSFVSIDAVAYQGETDGRATVTVDTVFSEVRSEFTIYLTEDGVEGFRLTDQGEFAWDPPAYADESAFEERTVTLDATESCDLGGTLSVPTGNDSVPGVVIVHGSGPVDRDATFGPNKPYKELAWGLASRGIAVLRYDKRTQACDADLADVTIDDVATDDALTAIQRLRDHDRVAADAVFVVGHSLGGALAPRIATRDGGLAGAVLLAPGPARPIEELVLDQQRHLLDQQDLTGEEREEAMAEVRESPSTTARKRPRRWRSRCFSDRVAATTR
ncbi:hypothetical protein BRD08_04700 [Halobacteriales archaeon SW_10_66_29]|nr:MAG: hypothetical protein BRD08_04700 [Halobacteriales archaeon SW_10_66_29]